MNQPKSNLLTQEERNEAWKAKRYSCADLWLEYVTYSKRQQAKRQEAQDFITQYGEDHYNKGRLMGLDEGAIDFCQFLTTDRPEFKDKTDLA